MAYEQEHPLINGASNNTTATQDTLGSGWMTAALSSSSDVDYFKITTTSAALIKLELKNTLLTATNYWNVALLDSNGDYVGSLTSTVSGTPLVDGTNTGTTLAVTGLTSAVPVGSRFTFATTSADTIIYTVTSVTALSSGGSTLTLDQNLPGSLVASTALVFDPAQSLAAGGTTTLTGQAPAAGTYYAKVAVSNWSDADYSIRASVLPTVESVGDNNAKDAAIPSSSTNENRPVEKAWMTGNLSDANDVDFWVFSTATMAGDILVDFQAASGDNNAPEWQLKLTQWTGDQALTTVQNVAISGTAGASKTFTIPSAKYSSANTYVVEVLKADGVTVDTGSYKLRVRGDTLDFNDTPVVTIDSVTSGLPYDVTNTGVVRTIKSSASTSTADLVSSKVALSTLFSASDADSGQTVSSYKVALNKASGETGSVAGSIALIESTGTVTATYGMSTTVELTTAQMAKAYLLPGAVIGNLSLSLQAFDSSGALDNSGASSIMQQTLRVVSNAVGVNSSNDGTLSLVEGASGSSETLTFSLATQPTQVVKVYIEQDSNNRFNFNHSVLTFAADSSFSTSQTVTVSARDNQVTEGTHSGQVSFRVVSTDSQYDGFSISPLTVAISDPVNNLPTGSVTIAGTLTQGQTLTASNTLADLDGLGAVSYQWSAGGNSISGAISSTLVLSEDQVGKVIAVTASYLDKLGHSESVASSATAAVANLNDSPTGSVTIAGTATQSQTLTASNTLVDLDGLGTISYQWKADGTAIGGANGSTYVLTSGEVGKIITVTASYTDGHSTPEAVTSSATSAVAAAASSGGGDSGSSVSPTTTTTTLPPVDGVDLTEKKETTTTGATKTTVSISAVPESWKPDPNSTSTTQPEIPLAKDSSGKSVLDVGIPIGVGLTSETLSGGSNSSFGSQLTASIQAKTGVSDAAFASLQQHINDYIPTVQADQQVTVRTITFSATNSAAAPGQPIHISGAVNSSDSSGNIIGAQEAIVIDTRSLAAGTALQLDNVEFAFVMGATHVTGGEGRNYVVGDDAVQYIVLGPDDDTLYGGGGNDYIGSLGGNDLLYGDGGNDTVTGGVGNDTISGGAGNDLLDGGSDIDTAVFSGKRANYAVSKMATGFSVKDNVGTDGTDTLGNTERLKFSDSTIALTMDGVNAGSDTSAAYNVLAEKLYVAYFGRPADATGFHNMASYLQTAQAPPDIQAFIAANATNATVKAIISSFGTSAESGRLYTGTTQEFVTAIFNNVLGRNPLTAGLTFWSDAIDTGVMSRGQAALNIMAGAEANTTAQGLIDAALIANRIVVAANFTSAIVTASGYSGSNAAAAARTMLRSVNQDTNVVDYQTFVESTLDTLGAGTPHAMGFSTESANPVLIGIADSAVGLG